MPKETTTSTKDPQLMMLWRSQRFYSELARTSTFLLVGTIALMTFLLSVGLQHPKIDLSIYLYTALGTLGLNLVVYVVGHLLHDRFMVSLMALEGAKGKDDVETLTASKERAAKNLKVVRVIQQILFVLGIIAVVALAIDSSRLFFAAAAQSSTSSTQ